jgi:hypothetical protein
MVHIGKGMVAIAAVAALGFLTVEDVAKGLITPAQSYAEGQDVGRDKAVVQNCALRDRAATSLRTLTEKQAANRGTEPKCGEQSWPYYSGDCLVRSHNRQAVPAVRIVGAQGRPVARVAEREPLPLSWLQPEALQYGVLTVTAQPRA